MENKFNIDGKIYEVIGIRTPKLGELVLKTSTTEPKVIKITNSNYQLISTILREIIETPFKLNEKMIYVDSERPTKDDLLIWPNGNRPSELVFQPKCFQSLPSLAIAQLIQLRDDLSEHIRAVEAELVESKQHNPCSEEYE